MILDLALLLVVVSCGTAETAAAPATPAAPAPSSPAPAATVATGAGPATPVAPAAPAPGVPGPPQPPPVLPPATAPGTGEPITLAPELCGARADLTSGRPARVRVRDGASLRTPCGMRHWSFPSAMTAAYRLVLAERSEVTLELGELDDSDPSAVYVRSGCVDPAPPIACGER